MPRSHALAMEAVAQAVANRERVVPRVPVDREIDAPRNPLAEPHVGREEVGAQHPGHIAEPRSPLGSIVA